MGRLNDPSHTRGLIMLITDDGGCDPRCRYYEYCGGFHDRNNRCPEWTMDTDGTTTGIWDGWVSLVTGHPNGGTDTTFDERGTDNV